MDDHLPIWHIREDWGKDHAKATLGKALADVVHHHLMLTLRVVAVTIRRQVCKLGYTMVYPTKWAYGK